MIRFCKYLCRLVYKPLDCSMEQFQIISKHSKWTGLHDMGHCLPLPTLTLIDAELIYIWRCRLKPDRRTVGSNVTEMQLWTLFYSSCLVVEFCYAD